MTVFDVIPASHWAQIGQRLKQKLSDHAPTIYEVEITRKDRTRIPVEVSSRLIYENGVPVGVQGTVRDISKRHHAEQALRESEERFLAVATSASDAIITIDEDGVIHMVNPATEKIFGYPSEEMVGQNLGTHARTIS